MRLVRPTCGHIKTDFIATEIILLISYWQKIQLYHNQIHGDYVDTLSPAHRLSSRHVLSRPPQGTLPRRQTNRCDVSICRQNIYSTLPRPSRRGQTTPTPAIRPTLIQLMLSCPETRSLLKELEMFTKGTRVYQWVEADSNIYKELCSLANYILLAGVLDA